MANPSGASSVAGGVMPPQVLGGPVWWYFVGVYVLAVVLSGYCLVDSLRPVRAERFAALWEPAWLYQVAHGLYLACVFAVWLPGTPRVLSVIPVALTPIALAFGVAYLLRVVFPKPREEERMR